MQSRGPLIKVTRRRLSRPALTNQPLNISRATDTRLCAGHEPALLAMQTAPSSCNASHANSTCYGRRSRVQHCQDFYRSSTSLKALYMPESTWIRIRQFSDISPQDSPLSFIVKYISKSNYVKPLQILSYANLQKTYEEDLLYFFSVVFPLQGFSTLNFFASFNFRLLIRSTQICGSTTDTSNHVIKTMHLNT